MAYSKTNWANDTTPAINATNLNKMEEGIYSADNVANNCNKNVNNSIMFPLNSYETANFTGSGSSVSCTQDDYDISTLTYNKPSGNVYFSKVLGQKSSVLSKKFKMIIENIGINDVKMADLLYSGGSDWGPNNSILYIYNSSLTIDAGQTVEITLDVSDYSEKASSFASDRNIYIIYRDGNSRNINKNEKLKITIFDLSNEAAPFYSFKSIHALSSDSASESDYSLESNLSAFSQLAKNAGWENDELYFSRFYRSDSASEAGMQWTTDENLTRILTIPAIQSVSSLCFASITYDIKSLFGHGCKLIFDITNQNYSGSLASCWYFDEWHITRSKDAWGDNIKNITGLDLADNHSKITIDLDDLEIDYENEPKIYLVIAAKQKSPFVSLPSNVLSLNLKISSDENLVIANEILDFNKDDYYTKEEIDEIIDITHYITCWGDSLTAGGGWTTVLQTLSGMPVYNGGTGGEGTKTIIARQGGDIMMINNITIPSDTTPVLIASRETDRGISTYLGNTVAPLLQSSPHVNPVKIGEIEGTLIWTGSNYDDPTGTWVFSRAESGTAVAINRPTAIRTNYDRLYNEPHLMIIFMGQNGGYDNLNDLVYQHRLMIEHSVAKHILVLGLSSGTASARADYEARMKQEFGRYFISLREYLSHPIYDVDGETIISCYGMADQNVAVDPNYEYDGRTTLEEIAEGIVPHQILADGVHYTSGTKEVIGNMLYKKCCELNIF